MLKASPFSEGGVGSIHGRGIRIPHAMGPNNQNIKQKHYYNKVNKNLKNNRTVYHPITQGLFILSTGKPLGGPALEGCLFASS